MVMLNEKKGGAISDPAFPSRSKSGFKNPMLRVYFLNLRTPTNPINPKASIRIVAG